MSKDNDNITVEKAPFPLKANEKWRVVINHDAYPLKNGIYGHYATKKKAMEVVVGLKKMTAYL